MKFKVLPFLLAAAVSGTALAGQLQDQIALADQAYANKNWAEYGQRYRELVAASPHNGLFWYRIGIAEREQQRLAPAIAAFEKAYALGQQRATSARWLATLEAYRQRPQQAAAWFVQARRDGLVNADLTLMQDPALSKLSQDPRFAAELLPTVAKGASRLERWQTDLAFLDLRVRESQWGFHDFQQAWDRGLTALRADLGRLEDWRIQVRLDALLRLAKSGHSWVLPSFDGPSPFHLAPLRIESFSDGWYVTASAPAWRHLLGKKVDAIAGLAPEQALEALRPLVPHESEAGLRAFGAMLVGIPEYLLSLGHGTRRDTLDLTIEGRYVAVAAPELTQERVGKVLQHHGVPESWVSARGDAAPAAWLRQPDRNGWIERLADDKLVYFQLNSIHNGEQSFAGLAGQLAQALAVPGTAGLVLDLRHNQGGNGDLNELLLQAMTSAPVLKQPGHLYVLISGRTFSAASLLIGDIEQHLDPIFVGTESGAGPTHIGEDNLIVLPNTGTKLMAATRMFVRSKSDDQRPSIAPHLEVRPRYADWMAGRDPVMEAVLRDWRGGKLGKPATGKPGKPGT